MTPKKPYCKECGDEIPSGKICSPCAASKWADCDDQDDNLEEPENENDDENE